MCEFRAGIARALLFLKHNVVQKGTTVEISAVQDFCRVHENANKNATNHVAFKLYRNQSRTHDIRGWYYKYDSPDKSAMLALEVLQVLPIHH